MDRFKKRHIILLSLLAIALVASIFYLRSDQNGKDYTLRPYESKDFQAAVTLVNINKFWVAERPEMFSPERMFLTRAPSAEPERKGIVEITIAEVDNQLAGFITYYRRSTEHGIIWVLAVDEKFRGRGIGEGLARHAIAYFKKNGVSSITLGTRTTNKPALSLYTKLGFIEQNRDEERGIVNLIKRNL